MIYSDFQFITEPTTQSLSYGYTFKESDLTYLSGRPVQNFPFGGMETDVINASVFSVDGFFLTQTTISSSLNYTPFTKSYIDINNVGHTYNYKTFQSDFAIVGEETKSLFVDVAKLLSGSGVSTGTYKLGISLVRYIVGNPEDDSRLLMVREISPSRTEMSVSPMTLSDSVDADDIALNTSYTAFSSDNFVVKQISNTLLSAIESPIIYDAYYKAYAADSASADLTKFYYAFKSDISLINFITDIYYGVRKGSLKSNGQFSSHDIYGIFDQFKNILFENYESVTSFDEIRNIYYSLFSYILNKELNQITNQKPAQFDQITSFFSSIFYDTIFLPYITKLEMEWEEYFSGYLKNSAEFVSGDVLPILNYQTSSRFDESGHRLLLLKFLSEIPTGISVGDRLWISNHMASDTVFQNVYYYENNPIQTIKLSGPNWLTQIENVGNGTSNSSLEDVIGVTGSLYDEVYTKMFEKSTSPTKLNVDYRYFENFVRFSSATNRLNVFSTKLNDIKIIQSEIEDVSVKLSINPSDEYYKSNLVDLNNKYDALEASMDGYEKFLYNNPTWFEAHTKLFNGISSASLYDRDNLSSLSNNLPSYIRENSANDGYATFVNMIGHYFDNLGGYIDQFTQKGNPSNAEDAGISKDVVYYMLESLGWEPETGRENLPLLMSSFSKADFDVSSSLWNMVGSMSEEDRSKTIWKRILNNLPYILKTKGTEAAITSLINCYGVPKNLLQIKEYGGIQQSSNVDSDALYIFDETKYSPKFSGTGEYIAVPWTGSVHSVEFNFTFDPFHVSEDGNVFRLVNCDNNWVIGCVRERGNDWGRVFFSIQDDSGSVLTSTTAAAPVFAGDSFSVLLRRHDVHSDFLVDPSASFATTDLYPQKYELFVHRNDDARTTYSVSSSILLSGSFNARWRNGSNVYFGNYQQMTSSLNVDPEAFFGTIDEIQLWETPVSLSRFDNHTSYHGAYDGSGPTEVIDKLLFLSTFAYPIDLFSSSGVVPFDNSAVRATIATASAVNFPMATSSVQYDAECNITTYASEFPYQFKIVDTHQYVRLPNFGSNKFKSNKVVEKSQTLVANLSSDNRSTLSSGEDGTIDSNKLGVFFSPNEQVNVDIMKFFGQFEFGDLIGDPSDVYSKTYKNFEQFRRLYFDQGGGQIDYATYLNIVRSYFDKSLFKYVKSLVPARTKLISGVVIEPTILERPKIQQKPTTVEVHRSFTSSIQLSNGKLDSNVIPQLADVIDIKTTGTAVYNDYCRSFYADQLDQYGFGVFADNGISYYNGDYWRADIVPVKKSIIVESRYRKPLAEADAFEVANTNRGEYQIISKSFESVNLSRFPVLYQYPVAPTFPLYTANEGVPNQRTYFVNFTGSVSSTIQSWDVGLPFDGNTYVVNTYIRSVNPAFPLKIRGETSATNVLSGSVIGSIEKNIGIDGVTQGDVRIIGTYDTANNTFTGSIVLRTGTTYLMDFYTLDKTQTVFDFISDKVSGQLFKEINDSSYEYRRYLSFLNTPFGSRPLNGYYLTHYRYKKPMFSRQTVRNFTSSGKVSTTFRKGLQTQKTTVQSDGLLDNSPPVIITKTS